MRTLAPYDSTNICINWLFYKNLFVFSNKVYSDKWCYHNEDCNQIQHAICSEDNVCVCISKYDRINETACGPLLKEYCDKSTDCATDNSICSGHECTCDDFFSRESNTRCLAGKYDPFQENS